MFARIVLIRELLWQMKILVCKEGARTKLCTSSIDLAEASDGGRRNRGGFGGEGVLDDRQHMSLISRELETKVFGEVAGKMWDSLVK